MHTTTQAAAILGLSPSTLRWQIRNGRIVAAKFGKAWMISADEIARYRRDVQRKDAA